MVIIFHFYFMDLVYWLLNPEYTYWLNEKNIDLLNTQKCPLERKERTNE